MISRLAASSFLRSSSSACRTPALHNSLRASSTLAQQPLESDSSKHWFLLAGATAAAAVAASTTTIVQCEEPASPPEPLAPTPTPPPTELEVEPDTSYDNEPVMEQILKQERLPVGDQKKAAPKKSWFSRKAAAAAVDYELPADAYDKLPDHDEETDCLLCRTHRQGPCRTVWRKFEHCVKDHTDNDSANAKTVCDKFVAPFEECWKQNVNMYTLIAMDVHQEDVHELELEFKGKADRKSWNPVIDWMVWLDFIRKAGSLKEALGEMTAWYSLDRKVPLWQRYQILEEKGDPIVIPVTTTVPTQQGGLLLQVVYAIDQDDMLIGYSEFDADYEEEQAKQEKRPVAKTHQLDIQVLPAMTENLRVFGLYKPRENPEMGAGKKPLNAVLYESPKVSPQTVAKQAKV
jgi:hypothetical protein